MRMAEVPVLQQSRLRGGTFFASILVVEFGERKDLMRRREFLVASASAVMGLAASKATVAAEGQSNRQLLELRTYRFASSAKQQAYERFLAEAAVAAFNRAGVEPVGIFRPTAKDDPASKAADDTDLYVLLPHNSMESVITLEDRLAADEGFQNAGVAILRAPKSAPAYTRYQSTLLLAMEGFPCVRVPAKSATRVFELRTYESHDTERARNKIEMFNKGEFTIFDHAGMPGVFFGGAVVGPDLPQLTYMVVHQDVADMKKGWSAFFNDPAWKGLSGNPAYKDNVSKVIDLLLRPGAGSQI